ncbi:MAG: SNF2 helicase associated domain-containing protein [Cellulosilyticum sp.]|nr:SNF2 helicase associated domain-containing protein [Cellulosilyticum sp.]
MLTMTDIRNKTNMTTYNKGKAIYNADKILDFYVTREGELDIIEATVEGSGKSKYDVTIDYDVMDDEIGGVTCECPAFYSYPGLCKHCVAVLMEYKDYKENYRAPMLADVDWEREHQMLAQFMDKMPPLSQTINPLQKEVRPTTPLFKQLLTKKAEKRTLPIVEQDIQGQVKIEPFLTITSDVKICLNFKLGVNQMYVLKDTVDFYHKMREQSCYSYGQKLKFTHHMNVFREEDRPLVQFICQCVEHSLREMPPTSYAYFSSPNLKYLQLNPEQLETFIQLMQGRSFQADVGHEEERIWQTTDEKLPRELTIEGSAEGVLVKLKYLFGIRCKTQSIYFHEGKVYQSSLKETESIQDFLSCMANIPNRCVYIEKQDVPIFCRELLPSLETFYVCHKENFNPLDYDVIPANFEIYLDAPQTDWITCRAEVLYNDKRYSVFESSQEMLLRDLVGEKVIERLVMTYATSYDEKEKQVVVSDEDKIYALLTQGIEKMSELAQVYVSDKLKRLKVKPSPKVAVGVSLSGDLMQLSMLSEELSNQELVDLLSQYKQKKRFYRLKNGDFINVEGEEMEVLLELKQSLQLSDEQLQSGQVQVPRYRALYLDSQLKSHQSLKTTKNKAFKELIRHMKTVEDNDFEVPVSLEETLREYQKRGFLWIKTLKHNGFGGILADDMGLGKTLQVITFLLSEYQEAKAQNELRTLIVCPASLVFNWKAEIEKFAPELTVKLMIGGTEERKTMLQALDGQEILVTSYDLLKRDIEYYKDLHFDYQIIDEGQYIKNHNTQAAKAVKAIKADFKLALTGTPIENRLSELWSLFDYLMPGFLYSYTRFKEELEQPIVQGKDEVAIRRLQKMIQPFTLRRLKKEVLTDLPDKLEENQYVILSGEQQKLYDANVEKLRLMLDGQTDEDFKQSKIQILSELTKLRQICCDPGLLYEDYKGDSAKLDVCMELIQNAMNGGHKILIFSQFTSMLDTLKQRLEREKINYYLLTGATSKEKRMQMVDAFNQDETPVFCISLKAGGTGLNLTAADIVIHYDPWWNIAVENQATDRAHRIGQQNVVSVYKLIAKGTIEENIIKIQSLKKELADQVLSGEGMSTGSFTKEEILELLQS